MASTFRMNRPAAVMARVGRRSLRVHARMGGLGPGIRLEPATGPGMGGPAPGMPGSSDAQYDPDDLFKGVPLKTGVIERRMMTKRMETDKEFAKAMSNAADELRQQAIARRELRRPPANHLELVEYFLNTVADDLEYEVARYRPRLTSDFFQYLDSVLGAERFSEKPDEDRVAELELLRRYLSEAAEAVDKYVAAMSTAQDRLKKLLTAKDKKAMILDMAAANEIDQALMDLLAQNIDKAKEAEQEDAAKFMEKVKQACAKYMVRTGGPDAAMPAVPGALGTRPDATGVPILSAAASTPMPSSPAPSPSTPAIVTPSSTPAAPAPAAAAPSKLINPKDPSGLRSAGKLII